MANKEFILQGFTTRTHRDAIRELFDVEDVQSVLISVAFASESGVEQILDQLRDVGDKLLVFAGIRNDITSYQAMTSLAGIKGISLFTVDTGARTIIFHPKLYLVRGANHARMIVGSANLTLGGLNNNVEAGLLLQFDLSEPNDRATVESVERELLALPHSYPDNVIQISQLGTLDEMLAAGRLTDESLLNAPRPSTSAGSKPGGSGSQDLVPRIKLKVPPLQTSLKVGKHIATSSPAASTAMPASPSPAPAAAITIPATAVVSPVAVTSTAGVKLELMWESAPLTERDLNIPTGATTNKTGSINLDKGRLPEYVDHRPYFYDEVFNSLSWTPRSLTVVEAYAKFQLILKGVDYGEYDLAVRHTTSTTSKSYLQKNAMTRLSWGPIKGYIANRSLIGRTLSLYRDAADPTRFVLEID